MTGKPSRSEKMETVLAEELAVFISQASNRTSLITVTRVVLEHAGALAHCYLTVLPEHAGKAAIDFLSRQESEARAYLQKRVKMGRIPHIQFSLDDAERTRRLIESL